MNTQLLSLWLSKLLTVLTPAGPTVPAGLCCSVEAATEAGQADEHGRAPTRLSTKMAGLGLWATVPKFWSNRIESPEIDPSMYKNLVMIKVASQMAGELFNK